MNDTGPKPEQRSEEEIIAEIIAGAVRISKKQKIEELNKLYMEIYGEEYEEATTFVDSDDKEVAPNWRLSYRGKILFLSFHEIEKGTGSFFTHIVNNSDFNSAEERIPETTPIYKAAKELMIRYKEETFKKPCKYAEITADPRMAIWLLTKGKEIFPNCKIVTKIGRTNKPESDISEAELLDLLINNPEEIENSNLAVALSTDI
ncbi:MAG: hypothetical protein WA057_02980 [Candidatus Magasanikiibacteriota bacterium]